DELHLHGVCVVQDMHEADQRDDLVACLNKGMAFLTAIASSRSKGSKRSSYSDNHSKQCSFQTEDLDTYDSDCDDISNTKVVLMANIFNYGSDVISKENVQDTNLQAQQDSMILSVIEQMLE
nr:hypothetical protein [Tanacetum cinerariifolium]